ncbi:MAG: alpha/beta hydrolase [Ferruginibacter sp.]
MMKTHQIPSLYLNREVTIDCYLPTHIANPSQYHLLLFNDGQDLAKMNLPAILNTFREQHHTPLFIVGIHASSDRIEEYGTAGQTDYKGRGKKAAAYQSFIREELFHFLMQEYPAYTFIHKGFAGFSMGGLSALDLVWAHPQIFDLVGVFSGSLWWRSLDQQDQAFDEQKHRIMHQRIKSGRFAPNLTFFFQTGTMDETADRNGNGIIDSIDDTMDLIDDLTEKGYDRGQSIYYLEIPNGRHDSATWAKALPDFLLWTSQQWH